MTKFGPAYDLKAHIQSTVDLGRTLIERANYLLTSSADPDDLKQANAIFASASAQIVALTKIHAQVLKADRERIREQTLIEVLKDTDPTLAERFIDAFEARLTQSDDEP